MEGYIGQIMLFVGNFAPKYWMFCQGQTLQISQYQALFSIIGNTYGGNGLTTFMLPNLVGKVPVQPGRLDNGMQVSQGQNVPMSTHGSGTIKSLGMNYIICWGGMYPVRP